MGLWREICILASVLGVTFDQQACPESMFARILEMFNCSYSTYFFLQYNFCMLYK